MDEGLRRELPEVSAVEQSVMDGIDAMRRATEISVKLINDIAQRPTNKKIDSMDEILSANIAMGGELIAGVVSLDYDIATKAQILTSIFVQSKKLRLSGFGIDVPEAFLDLMNNDLYPQLHETLASEDEIFYDGEDYYDLVGYLSQVYNDDLLEDVGAHIAGAQEKSFYKFIRTIETNKRDIAVNAIGAFLGFSIARLLFRR